MIGSLLFSFGLSVIKNGTFMKLRVSVNDRYESISIIVFNGAKPQFNIFYH